MEPETQNPPASRFCLDCAIELRDMLALDVGPWCSDCRDLLSRMLSARRIIPILEDDPDPGAALDGWIMQSQAGRIPCPFCGELVDCATITADGTRSSLETTCPYCGEPVRIRFHMLKLYQLTAMVR